VGGGLAAMQALRPFTRRSFPVTARLFPPTSWNSVSLIGDRRVVPYLLADTRVIMYWRDMLDEAGIDETAASRP
jgi:hypothetical protein